jgi:hypothetical protein
LKNDAALQEYVDALKRALPEVFSGPAIGKLTGGLFSWGSVRNLRAQGEIPEECFGPRIGGANAPTPVLRDQFIAWAVARILRRRGLGATPSAAEPAEV